MINDQTQDQNVDLKEEPEANGTPETTQENEPEEVIEEVQESVEEPEADPMAALQQEIENLNKQLAQSKTDLLRAYADTDNTRKRLQREADLAKQYRFQSAAKELLPVLDNLETALNHVPENEETKNFAKGFELILNQLVNVLNQEGVVEIEALNQPFDANLMQALMMEAVEGTEPGMVTEVLQKGYKIKDRLLRPALVKVSE